ncbi:MAG: copper-binding protein [Georgfuchsia sp.]
MKTFIVPALIAIAATGFSAQGIAASDMHGDHEMMHMHSSSAAETSLVDGVVKKIDKSAGKLTLSHGPLPNGMPGMTMAFRVKEAAWLDQVKEGQKIRFVAEQVDGAMTLVRFEPAK